MLQLPKPDSSITSTILFTRFALSGSPCGNIAYWATFAEVNNIAAPLGQAATHAPHPIHAAEGVKGVE